MKRFDKVTGAALSLTGVIMATAIGVGVTRAAQGPEAPAPTAAIEAAASASPSPAQPSTGAVGNPFSPFAGQLAISQLQRSDDDNTPTPSPSPAATPSARRAVDVDDLVTLPDGRVVKLRGDGTIDDDFGDGDDDADEDEDDDRDDARSGSNSGPGSGGDSAKDNSGPGNYEHPGRGRDRVESDDD